ncbi:MAG: flagellar biosynthesis protein FlhB [Planctomycetes bacterium]|nr:flagellar biosynthesis protein FlhB [Planctomycetota bacterium]
MAEKPAGERTEKPSPRRIRKTRKKGKVPQSQELPSVISLATLLVVCTVMGPKVFRWFRTQISESMAINNEFMSGPDAFVGFFSSKMIEMTLIAAPFFIALTVAGIASSIFVGGITWSMNPLKWKLSAISPIKGVKNLFSLSSVMNLFLSVVKIIIISVIVYLYFRDKLPSFMELQWLWPADMPGAIAEPVAGVVLRICIALISVALIDVAYQKWKYMKDMKMTKQELKEEHKETDGSPEVKSKLRQKQIAIATKRMLKEVPKADVILVNPTHVAVAIRYDSAVSDAPVVKAKGGDHMCEKIKEIARAYGVPIVRKPKLARTIFKTVKIDEPVPESLFVAVAEILAMIYRLRQKKRMAQANV